MRDLLYLELQFPEKDLRFWDDLSDIFDQLDGNDITNFFKKYLTRDYSDRDQPTECRKLSIYVYKAGVHLPDC